MMERTILLVEDSDDDAELTGRAIERAGVATLITRRVTAPSARVARRHILDSGVREEPREKRVRRGPQNLATWRHC